MATYHTTLEVGQVLLIPAGAGASIELVEKSGRKAKFKITCDTPVTVTQAPRARAPQPAPTTTPTPPLRRPVPSSR